MNRPQPDEHAPFYKGYIETVADDVIDELETQAHAFPDFLRALPPEKADYAYAEGKWTLKELLGHIIDTERIMTYRILCISRQDPTPLPGFDENEYVKKSRYLNQDFGKLIEEFGVLRRANLYLFRSLQESELSYRGMANNCTVSVRALLFIIAGHVNHHRKIITERYL